MLLKNTNLFPTLKYTKDSYKNSITLQGQSFILLEMVLTGFITNLYLYTHHKYLPLDEDLDDSLEQWPNLFLLLFYVNTRKKIENICRNLEVNQGIKTIKKNNKILSSQITKLAKFRYRIDKINALF